jgi:hypothetical protein
VIERRSSANAVKMSMAATGRLERQNGGICGTGSERCRR